MRILGRALRILVFIVTLIVTATTAAVIVSQTAWFKGWLRGYMVRQANQYLDGELSIGRLSGNLFSGIALDRVALSMHGEQVVAIESMAVTYDIPDMIRHGVSIARISLQRPVVVLERNENGDYAFARLIKRRGDQTDRPGDGPRFALNADKVTLLMSALPCAAICAPSFSSSSAICCELLPAAPSSRSASVMP